MFRQTDDERDAVVKVEQQVEGDGRQSKQPPLSSKKHIELRIQQHQQAQNQEKREDQRTVRQVRENKQDHEQ